MEIFVLHILKLNIIAAVIILLVKPLAILFKGQVSARWKYIIWLLITVSLCIPVRLPANFTLVDFKVQRSIQQNEQNSKTTDYAARPGERQQKMEIMSSVNNNTKSQSEVPEQKEFIVHTAGKWLETIAVIFASVWLSVAVLKLAGKRVCAEHRSSDRMRVLLHHFWQDSSIQSCIFRQQAIPQRSENWYFTMNLHIIVIGISGIRCFFESVQQYTGLIRFFLLC